MGGYFNVGDVLIFIAALTFNPITGRVARGLGSALTEGPANITQIAIGGLIGIPIALVLRRRLPEILRA